MNLLTICLFLLSAMTSFASSSDNLILKCDKDYWGKRNPHIKVFVYGSLKDRNTSVEVFDSHCKNPDGCYYSDLKWKKIFSQKNTCTNDCPSVSTGTDYLNSQDYSTFGFVTNGAIPFYLRVNNFNTQDEYSNNNAVGQVMISSELHYHCRNQDSVDGKYGCIVRCDWAE